MGLLDFFHKLKNAQIFVWKVSYGRICRESFNLLCVDNLSYFVFGQSKQNHLSNKWAYIPVALVRRKASCLN